MRVLALEGRSSGFSFTSWAPFGGGAGISGSEGFGAAGVDSEVLASVAGGEAVLEGWGGSGRAASVLVGSGTLEAAPGAAVELEPEGAPVVGVG